MNPESFSRSEAAANKDIGEGVRKEHPVPEEEVSPQTSTEKIAFENTAEILDNSSYGKLTAEEQKEMHDKMYDKAKGLVEFYLARKEMTPNERNENLRQSLRQYAETLGLTLDEGLVNFE